MCRSKANPKHFLSAPKRNFYVQEEQTLQLEDAEAYGMCTVNSSTRKPIILDVYLNDIPIKMKLDTGASLSIICSTTYKAITQQSGVHLCGEVHHSPKNLHRRIHQSPGNHICECKVWLLEGGTYYSCCRQGWARLDG